MRKVVALAALVVGALVLAAVAYGAQVNTYTVDGSVSPSKPGTKKKPVPIELRFDYTVGEASGQRPAPVKRYSIAFYGGATNGGLFPKCTAAAVNAAQSDSVCPKGSAVGTGTIINSSGASNDPSDTSIACNLTLTLYNSGQGRAALWLKGGPTQMVAGKNCVIAISQAIDAKYVSAFGGKGVALQFDVPANLLHPVGGLDNAVTQVTSTVRKLTAKKNGVTHGYYESNQPCQKGGKRPITVTFTAEDGQEKTATDDMGC